ncbi:Na/Pi cotransporter family protein [Leptospira sp. 2 VSF19]|uniref:Na/Pi cotransporter family protein n=1 Tax=Leptospira soteropolitanensis TaxID=2950025 RepID=A0AAW5VIN2_9LEPT|nr:Na/Pi cotransporter family protein [Leptospira soteropolitanensis]MCW7491212.1 Na/Pi cotransporter family protein [Leptospira soteropolitanensis]MCW7498796.1 Na/Pi cotransporter family protein [Leptospira soteropolitanensis]MCW7521611.1 Na/Pi cotransporter family protein [Leptospira soteropolitanensis]MCW7524900.1 Na/Pi cotransporter family protein [Leptospira soteropolitanensis]MCW7528767.1 Na/Pi cotransporter family protein [Leptospira soteropolitanensis]
MNWSLLIQVLGGLGIFIYGMKLLSESLQRVAGDRLRSFLSSMTRNRVSAVFSGLFITSTIQSSSATTVLVVGFVNAGLISLAQAIGVIMGANIGTTITAWIVSFLGFKFNIASFALPAVAAGVILNFSRKESRSGWGSFLIGFGFLFLGLDYLKTSVPDSAKDPESFLFLQQYTSMGFNTILLFVLIGALLTIVIQSSSASTTITITLAFSGYIPIDAAYGMILGENIGTTITANLAAIPGNRNAKKAALAHTMFNVFGVVWALLFFKLFTGIVDDLIPGDPLTDKESTRFHISLFHTMFNVTNTLVLIWFVNTISKVVSAIVDGLASKTGKDKDSIRLLQAGAVKTTELAMVELVEFTKKIIRDTYDFLRLTEQILLQPYDATRVLQVLKKEEELDQVRTEVLTYLNQIQETGITGNYAKDVLGIMERVKAVEEMGDNFASIARKMRKSHRQKVSLDKTFGNSVKEQMDLLKHHYDILLVNLDQSETFDILGNPQIRNQSREYRFQMIRSIKKNDSKVKKKKYQKKDNLMPALLYRDVSRNLDNISRLLNAAIYADV